MTERGGDGVPEVEMLPEESAEDRLRRELDRLRAEYQEFLAIVSHDLQEPVRTVGSYLELIARRYAGKLDKDADEFIGFAKEGSVRIQAMLGDLLALSRVSSRGGPLVLTDVQDLYQRALERLQGVIEREKALVTCDPLPKIVADGPQLELVLSHLLGNALKFRSPGAPPRVHVSVDRSSGEWTFSVRDNGIGIEAKDVPRLFGVFQRLHPRDQYPGTGMGLATCKRIVERHGGRIGLESKPGRGTTVRFTMPTRSGDPTPAAGAKGKA